MKAVRLGCTTALLASAILAATAAPLWAKSPKLPVTAPVPDMNRVEAPDEAAPGQPPQSGDVPVPEKRPPGPNDAKPPETAPAPPPKPVGAGKAADQSDETEPNPAGSDKAPEKQEPAKTEKTRPPDPRSSAVAADELPAEEIACRGRLKALGVVFEEHAAEHDAKVGCSIPYPIVVSKLSPSIDLAPEAELNCPMAEALGRFMKDVVTPAAKEELGSQVKAIAQASAYVCRPRHNGGKISEHAFGNALDIASFTLADDTRVDVGPKPSEKQGKFLDKVRAAACGPFKTVLGPGSDPDHELHFHLDLEPRRHNGTFCQ